MVTGVGVGNVATFVADESGGSGVVKLYLGWWFEALAGVYVGDVAMPQCDATLCGGDGKLGADGGSEDVVPLVGVVGAL